MPTSKSAKKRMRTSEEARVRNLAVKTSLKHARTRFLTAAAGKDEAKRKEAFRAYCSDLDEAAKKGVIGKNTAVRRKTRAAEKIRAKA